MLDLPATTPPKPSSIPKFAGDLLVNLDPSTALKSADKYRLNALITFQRAANYLTTAQIFLQSNSLLQSPLTKDDIKPRLLGHFGTCPGLNLVYSQASALLTRTPEARFLFVTGPGHGAPAILSCLFLEGTIERFYPQYTIDGPGIEKFVRAFSWPGGFPSHINAETPGSIHEGGELGYALAVAYGSVMDSPELITVCVVGDGESETGPTSTAWHAHKFIDPAESGAVLPVLHVNGFKISERTLPGTMDDLELGCLFTGYGYQVRIVSYDYHLASKSEEQAQRLLNADFAVSLEWAYNEIKKIQYAARSGQPLVKPRWPILILRSPKGMTGPKSLNHLPLADSFRSHQTVLPSAKVDDEQLGLLKTWLESYKPHELFIIGKRGDTFFNEEIRKILPDEGRRMGLAKESNGAYYPLDVPDFKAFGCDTKKDVSAMKAIGKLLSEVIARNQKTFRIFSPDEFASNKLDAVFENTHRQFQWDPETANNGGRVIEMLSEHTLQGFLQGYTLTGRTGLFPSYEAFLGIVGTMIEQFAKFRKVASETKWRGDVPSMNYIETSTLWRQEHNGYSHQNPGFISTLLTLPSNMVRIYLPPDANTAVSVMAHCLRSKNYVNLIIGSKADTTCFLDIDQAEKHCVAGLSIWEKYSTDCGYNPDVILVGIGVETTAEVVAASSLLQNEGVRVRVVNVVDLMVLGEAGTHPHALDGDAFNSIFGQETPVVINFHGYPAHLKSLLFSRNQPMGRKRFEILGYIEEGTTTTPWSMLRLNQAGRFDIADRALGLIVSVGSNLKLAGRAHELQTWYKHQNLIHQEYATEHGMDSPELAKLY